MPRRLVVCCDGTWNVPDEERRGITAPTNVTKLALAVVCGEGTDQLLFYEPGVGTSPDERVMGGAFGYGLSRNIRSAYSFLAQSYRDGDELFLFGFSRGAYTARSLAGLIRNCGILRAEHADKVDVAYGFYRDSSSRTHPDGLASALFREMYAHGDQEIHFIGVWDTVGALGIPTALPGADWLTNHVKEFQEAWGFHNTQLSRSVRHAYHALAIDETREPFRPTLWSQAPDPGDQTLEQVWFAGVHTEVGGGSDDTSLSDIALLWMVEKAKACGLELRPNAFAFAGANGAAGPSHTTGPNDAAGPGAVRPYYGGPIVDSRHGLWDAVRAYHRLDELAVHGAPGQAMASSVVRRAHDEALRYAPRGLAAYLAALPTVQVVEEPAGLVTAP